MNDDRVWTFEENLWVGTPEAFEAAVDGEFLMVLPASPYVLDGRQAIDAVKEAPRWAHIAFSDQKIARPQEGLIVVAYAITAQREGGDAYKAHCTSTYRRLAHDDWRVVQHQQTPAASAST